MKLFLFTAILTGLLLTATENAEAQERKGFIGLGLGASLPTGSFGHNYPSSGAGYARTGIAVDMGAGFQLWPYLGAQLLFRSQLHGHDTEALLGSPDFNSNGWFTRSLMAGPYLSLPLGPAKKTHLEFRALAGYCRTRSPEVTRTVFSSFGESFVVVQRADKANSIAAMAGAGLRLAVSDRIGFTLNADYFVTNPEFKHESQTVAPIALVISSVSTTLSFQYRFLEVLQKRQKPGLLDNGTF